MSTYETADSIINMNEYRMRLAFTYKLQVLLKIIGSFVIVLFFLREPF